MTTETFYASSGRGGYTYHRSTSSWNAAKGGSVGSFVSNSETMLAGNRFQAGTTWDAVQSYVEFDTSSLPDSIIVNSITLRSYKLSGVVVENQFTLLVKEYDYGGGSVTTGDFHTDYSVFSSLPTLASLVIPADNLSGVVTFTSTEDFKTAVNTTGSTRLALISSDSFASGPSGYDAKALVIYRATPVAGEVFSLEIDYTTIISQSISGSVGAFNGTTTKQARKQISGIISNISGSLFAGDITLLSLSGGILNITGSISKLTYNLRYGVITPAGEQIKRINIHHSGSLNPAGVLVPIKTYLQSILGTLSNLSGAISNKQTAFGVNLTGVINSVNSSIYRLTIKNTIGSIAPVGRVGLLASSRYAIMNAGRVFVKKIRGGTVT